MELRKLGNTDIEVSIMCLGCWAMGGGAWGGPRDEDSLASIRAAIDSGINFIDTAEGYGHSEELIGAALDGVDAEVIIATKSVSANLSRDKFQATIDTARSRLRRDCIDLFYIHWPTTQVPNEEALESLAAAKEQGTIRAIGVSNFSLDEMRKAVTVTQIDAMQPPLSILWPFAREELIPFCKQHNIAVAPYSPMARGLLTGKFTKDWEFPKGDDRRRNVPFRPENYARCLEVVDRLRPIAAKYGKTMAQLAINWVAYHDGVTSAIVGVRSVEQLNDNLGAFGWRISEEDLELIDEIARPATDPMRAYPNPFSVLF